jgi:hypothetical protein
MLPASAGRWDLVFGTDGGPQVNGHAAGEQDHASLLRPFLAPRWRPRYDSIRPGSARRSEVYNKLCHYYADVLDWRYARPTPGGDLEKELRRFGPAAFCYCLCGPEEFDGREVPLAEALAALVGRGLPVLLVCRPGALAYFEPEYVSGAGQRFIHQPPVVKPAVMADGAA